MENNEEIRKEDKRAIKEVFIKLIDEEPKEMSQEEAIKNYSEITTKKPTSSATSEDEGNSNQEEVEHLKRVKAELLASLKRVEDLSKKIFTDKELKLKVVLKDKDSKGGINNLQKDMGKDYATEIKNNESPKYLNTDDEKTIE